MMDKCQEAMIGFIWCTLIKNIPENQCVTVLLRQVGGLFVNI